MSQATNWDSARTRWRPRAVLGSSVLVVIAWAVSGPLFDYSDSWQFTINTGTTIVTFIMVFLI